MKVNTQAAVLAVISGALLLLVGYTGVANVDRIFALLESWFGTSPALLLVSRILGAVAALGGVAVLVGGYLIGTNRVRTGRILIVLGSGAGLLTLLVFLARNLVSEEFSYLLAVLPAVLGVAFGIAAQWRAKPVPILP